MNTYIIKAALVACLGIAPAMTYTEGFSWNNGRFNIQLGTNISSTTCDAYGCTITKTDDNGNFTTTYTPHDIDGVIFRDCDIGTIHKNGQKIVLNDLNGNVSSVINSNNNTVINSNNKYYGGTVQTILKNNRATEINRYDGNTEFVYNAGDANTTMHRNIVIPIQVGDKIQEKNRSIRKNGKKLGEIKKLSGQKVDVATSSDLKVNKIDVPSYLARVKVGNQSGISCDSAIANDVTFDTKDGHLTASLKNPYKYKGKAPCKILVQMLGSELQAINDADVRLKQSEINTIESRNAYIKGSLVSNTNNLKTKANNGTLDITPIGTYEKITIDAQGNSSNIALRDIDTKNLKVKSQDRNRIYVSGNTDKQDIRLGQQTVYDGQNLKSRICNVFAGSWALTKLYVTEKLKGNANSYAKVWFRGNPNARK